VVGDYEDLEVLLGAHFRELIADAAGSSGDDSELRPSSVFMTPPEANGCHSGGFPLVAALNASSRERS
jgi:hypothetical protein